MPARIDELCDAAKLAIESAMTTGDATVTVADVPETNYETLTGRQVFVANAGYEDRGPVTRGAHQRAYSLAVLVAEVCPDATMSLDWRRARTQWVNEKVYAVLGDERNPIDGAYAERIEVSEDREEQITHNLFWSLVEVTLVEDDE